MAFKYNGDRANERLKDKVVHMYQNEKLTMRKISSKLGISTRKVWTLLDCHHNGRSQGKITAHLLSHQYKKEK